MSPETPATWRTVIGSAFSDAKFYVPASAKEIEWAERDLGVAFPPELRQLLLETNGASAHHGAPLVWPLSEIVEQNKHFWTSTAFAKLYKPFTGLLFFGAEGNGDQVAYRIADRRIDDTSIYEWDHETDERTPYASDLRDYVRRTAAFVEPTGPPPRRSFLARIAAWLTKSGPR